MPTLKQIQNKIAALNSDIDRIIDSGLMKDIEKYQKEYERAIRDAKFDLNDGRFGKTSRNYLIATSIDKKMSNDFAALSQKHFKKYNAVGQMSLDFNEYIGYSKSVDFKDISAIKQIKKLDFSSFYQESKELDTLIKRQLVNSIAAGSNFSTSVKNLSEQLLGTGQTLGKLERYSTTYMRTSLFSFNNTIDKTIYDRMGGKELTAEYLYIGPILDKRIRPFCLNHVGKTYTVAQINNFPAQNRSGLNPFTVAPGGWNCRHKMILKSPTITL